MIYVEAVLGGRQSIVFGQSEDPGDEHDSFSNDGRMTSFAMNEEDVPHSSLLNKPGVHVVIIREGVLGKGHQRRGRWCKAITVPPL